MSNLKGRNWAFIMYPESMPDDWYDRLQMTGLPIAISPLHDKDLNPTGDEKKPHFHVLCYYENPTTSTNVKKLVSDLVYGTIPIKLESLRGMYRYHVHKDNPEKYQYSDTERIFINGFDSKKCEDLSYHEVKAILRKIRSDIVKYDIYEYSDLLDFYQDNEMLNELDIAEDKTIVLNTYISSRRYKHESEYKMSLKKNINKSVDNFP